MRWLAACSCALLLVADSLGADPASEPIKPAAQDSAFFENKVRPVLVDNCFKCHGSEKTNGKLRVDTREMLLEGGRSVVAENLPADALGVFQG